MARDDRLVLFVAELMDTGRPSSTISSCVSAVRSVLKDDGVDMGKNSILLSAMLRSCRVNNKSESSLRLPIQKGLFHMVIDKLEMYDMSEHNQPFLCRLHKAILVTGYYGLLRIGKMMKAEC